MVLGLGLPYASGYSVRLFSLGLNGVSLGEYSGPFSD